MVAQTSICKASHVPWLVSSACQDKPLKLSHSAARYDDEASKSSMVSLILVKLLVVEKW